MIYKTLHGKLNIVQLESHSKKERVEYRCSERVSSSYSTSGTPYITLVTKIFLLKKTCFGYRHFWMGMGMGYTNYAPPF
jgi:hypothetical protein